MRFRWILIIIVVLLIDVLASLWFLSPLFRREISRSYNSLLYKTVPYYEYSGRKFFYNENNKNKFSSIDGRKFHQEGALTTITSRDGIIQEVYSGTVNTIYLPERKLAISNNADVRMLTIPQNTDVRMRMWENENNKTEGKITDIKKASFEDIHIGDYIYFENASSPVLFVSPQ